MLSLIYTLIEYFFGMIVSVELKKRTEHWKGWVFWGSIKCGSLRCGVLLLILNEKTICDFILKFKLKYNLTICASTKAWWSVRSCLSLACFDQDEIQSSIVSDNANWVDDRRNCSVSRILLLKINSAGMGSCSKDHLLWTRESKRIAFRWRSTSWFALSTIPSPC